ncbi:hypothetical protein NM96_08975 [Neisseria mucosa]|nr:hypothetical protein NM96_08975 [Neisseria mucosa]
MYNGLNLNQDKATKSQTVQIVRQGEATPYWFKVNPLYSPKKTVCKPSKLFRRPSNRYDGKSNQQGSKHHVKQ